MASIVPYTKSGTMSRLKDENKAHNKGKKLKGKMEERPPPYSGLPQPIYPSLTTYVRPEDDETSVSGQRHGMAKTAFTNIKTVLTENLALPDCSKPFRRTVDCKGEYMTSIPTW